MLKLRLNKVQSHTLSSAHGMLSIDVPIMVFQRENLNKANKSIAKITRIN